MRAAWIVAVAAGAMIGSATTGTLDAQDVPSSRQQQELQRQRDRAEANRRAAERDRMRRQQQAANARGLVVRRIDVRDGDYYRADARFDRRGPAFCRSGEGHPRYGRQWCRDKGYGLGRERYRDIWGDIQFRRNRYDNRLMNRGVLVTILGPAAVGQFDVYGRTHYGNGPMYGRWLDNRMTMLQLYVGSVPIARLVDTNRDGRVDMVTLVR